MTERLVVTAEGQRRWRRVAPPALRRRALGHPTQVVAAAFAVAIGIGTALLMLPVSVQPGQSPSFRAALFTATSATSVTGLSVVEVDSHFSTFGQIVILLQIEIGGLGIITIASLLSLLVARRLGLRSRLLTQAETGAHALGDIARIARGIVLFSLLFQGVVMALLTARYWLAYGGLGEAAWFGLSNSVSAYNNAGFSFQKEGLVPYVADPWVCLPVALGIIAGSLGFPVLLELFHRIRPRRWSVHTKVTLAMTAALLVLGPLAVTWFEWTNPATLGPLTVPGKLLAGFFQGVTPRTAGFATLDYSAMNETTWLATDLLMFVGGAPLSTAGGIKVTAFAVLLFAIIAEIRGNPGVEIFDREVPNAAVRQALSIALLAVAIVATGTIAMLAVTELDLDRALFEVVSAFATVGLSTGITAELPVSAELILVALMYVGRIGTITLASALALRERRQLYRLPEGRPIVG
jgi:trk system potassium uptake protein